jgi:hypothetical protein
MPQSESSVEILKIRVGEPTRLGDKVYQNTANLMVSRTGVVAAFFPDAKSYRTSTDGGRTWSEKMKGPSELGGGADSGTLRDGGVIMPVSDVRHAADGKEGWFEMPFLRFTDDMRYWDVETARLYLPLAGPPSLDAVLPSMAKGKMVQLPNGDVLAPMYGGFKGDSESLHRAFLVCSKDQGHTWHHYSSIAYEPVDPNPELPGQYLSSCEPSITLLPNGRMLAMLRTQFSHLPAQYRPLYGCWSDDLGKTWTRPVATRPHLMCISPTLAALDNGVVACEYGRPGFHVAFSLDNGHTWQDRISFSDLPEPVITGQFDMIKAGPNQLVVVGSDAEATKVWPIAVERAKVSPAYASLQGRVLDQQGQPLVHATVERSPNRYAADFWQESTELDPWGGGPRLVGSPQLGYRSIHPKNNHPLVKTDARGHFRFDGVPLGEMVLTVEANGYAPQWRHVKVGPEAESHAAEFRLNPGKAVRGRVVDSQGQPLPGASVVLDMWHVYSDVDGYFDWPVEDPVPEQVELKVHKRYRREYKMFKKTIPRAQIEKQPIVLQREI